MGQIGKEINHDPTEAAKLMEEETKIAARHGKLFLKGKDSDINYMDEDAVHDLQKQVQDLLDIGLIENDINVEGKVWYPEGK